MFFSPWGCSSVGRALEWHSRGQEFNSLQLHHISKGRYHKDIGLFLFSTPKFGKEFRLSPCISAVRQLSAELRDALRRSVCHLRAAAVLQPYAPVITAIQTRAGLAFLSPTLFTPCMGLPEGGATPPARTGIVFPGFGVPFGAHSLCGFSISRTGTAMFMHLIPVFSMITPGERHHGAVHRPGAGTRRRDRKPEEPNAPHPRTDSPSRFPALNGLSVRSVRMRARSWGSSCSGIQSRLPRGAGRQ